MYKQYAFVNVYYFMKLRFLFCVVIFIKKQPFHKVSEIFKFQHGHNNLEVDNPLPTLASVPSTQYPAIMHPFLLSVHQLSNSSLDSPLCIIPGLASTTDGPISSKCSILCNYSHYQINQQQHNTSEQPLKDIKMKVDKVKLLIE